eukprot:GEMP01031945.1.p1 GENE.GEMP01031945.1~~GEMP01031945.1.p1  ORF type:complete len:408 (+),score=89.60 GEMP01031945.1:134-1357(+)
MAPSPIPMSRIAARTINPIRQIVDRMSVKPASDKPLIPLSIGDPTVYRNFMVPSHARDTLHKLADEMPLNGYLHSCGAENARAAIAKKFGVNRRFPITAHDVVITAGCSQALDLAFTVLANPGEHNVLLPRPGFSLYITLCASKGIEMRFYDLVPDKQWEIDLEHMESLIDANTSAILINNPSNPCGSNFSRTHLENILAVAQKHKLPLISDEIYANMVFEGNTFTSIDEVSDDVPALVVGGLAKQYMVPGWRVGWVIAHDRNNRLAEIKKGLADLSTLTLGATSYVAGLIPSLLEETPESYYTDIMQRLQAHAEVIVNGLRGVPGLRVVEPQGAMYILVEADVARMGLKNDLEFSQELLREESVVVLPGQCFQIPNFFRIVITPPQDKLVEACERIRNFCVRRMKK